MNLDIQKIQALCFDVDGTLSDTDDQYVTKFEKIFRPFSFLFKDKKQTKETLDLVSDNKSKPSRRQRQRDEAAKTKTLDDKKKEALDIFEEEGKKK